MSSTSAWYVVHSRPNGEATALRNLARQGFTTFLPRIARRRSHARKVETVLRPLFPRYLFINLDLGIDRWLSVRSTFGVSEILQHGDRPAAVPSGLVEKLAVRCGSTGILVSDEPSFAPGDPVRVLGGIFTDLIGTFERMADHERVAVLLDLMGRSARVLIAREMLEPA